MPQVPGLGWCQSSTPSAAPSPLQHSVGHQYHCTDLRATPWGSLRAGKVWRSQPPKGLLRPRGSWKCHFCAQLLSPQNIKGGIQWVQGRQHLHIGGCIPRANPRQCNGQECHFCPGQHLVCIYTSMSPKCLELNWIHRNKVLTTSHPTRAGS